MDDQGEDGEVRQQLFPVPRGMADVIVRNMAAGVADDSKPTIEVLAGKKYLAFRRRAEGQEPSEFMELFPIGDEVLTSAQLDKLQSLLGEDFKDVVRDGLCKGLEKINDATIQGIFLSMLTRYNPRQVAILLFIYRHAHQSKTGPTVKFMCNDLLGALYTASNEKKYPSNLRGQINKDFWDLNDIKFDYPDPDFDAERPYMIDISIKSILTIDKYHIDGRHFRVDEKNFDWKALGYPVTRMPDAYTVTLTFYKSIESEGGYFLLPMDLNLKQPDSVPTSRNYKSKLFTVLMSRFVHDANCIHVPLTDLFHLLALNGKNTSRKTTTIRKAATQLCDEGILQSFAELRDLDSAQQVVFRFVPNQQKFRYVP